MKKITFDSQMGCESFPLPSLPNFTASCAFPSNNSRHTTVASWISQESSQTVPQSPSCIISTRPSKWLLPPTSLILVRGGPFVRPLSQVLTHEVPVKKKTFTLALRTFAPKNFPRTDFFKTLTDGRK